MTSQEDSKEKSRSPHDGHVAISVVIPLYNEAQRVEHGLEKALRFLTNQRLTYEIIAVDDGSHDETLSLLRRFASAHDHLHILQNPRNYGKGYSIKRGVLSSVGSYVLFTDIDFSVPVDTIPVYLENLSHGCSIVIGSRNLPESRIEKYQPFLRKLLGEAFLRISRFLFLGHISDVTCGMKAFQGDVARNIFTLSRIHRWGFDVEILYLAKKFGYPVTELPIRWSDSPQSKVSMIRDVIVTAWEMVKIGYYTVSGKYR